ncbi:MAG: hypothetical protein ACO3V7_07265 [Burkholderiaceae bacterium]
MELALAADRREQAMMADTQPTLEREVQRLTGLQPNIERSNILPYYGRETGLVAPQVLYDAAKAIVAPGFTAQGGRVSPEEAFNVAANITGGSIGGSALAPVEGTIAGMGASRKTPKVSYERRQEGPFLRIRQTGASGTPAADVGAGKAPQRTPQGGNVRGGQSLAVASDNAPSVVSGRRLTPAQVAGQYTEREFGTPYKLPKNPPSSLQKQAPIGRIFLEATKETPEYKAAALKSYDRVMPDVLQKAKVKSYDDLLEKSYLQLAKEVKSQFDSLPISMSYYRGGEGNYKSSKEMFEDIDKRGHMFVYQGGEPHDFLGSVDPDTGLSYNEMFRAVHDYFGHAVHRNQFGPVGEETAWAAHSQMFSPLARIAMSSETRGQNSLVNYSPLNAELKNSILEADAEIAAAQQYGYDEKTLNRLRANRQKLFNNFQYAPQKSVVLPAEMIQIDYMGAPIPGFEGLILPDPGTAQSLALTHYSKSPNLTQTDPSRYGTGIKGEEAARLRRAPDIRERTYFYTGKPGAVPPEAGLGPNVYTAQGENLYNMRRDPAKLGILADVVNTTSPMAQMNPGAIDAAQRANDFERLMRAYGYAGYYSPEARVATVFEPTRVKLAKALRR